MNAGLSRSRALWVPVLAVVGGIVLGTAIVNVVGQPSSSTTPQPSNFEPGASASIHVGSPSSAMSASAEPTPGIAGVWTISHLPNATPGDQLERIIALGDQLFVVGSHDGQGGIWHTRNGVDWQLATARPTTGAELGAQIHDLAQTDAGYVAVGANYVIDGAFPLIWHSEDGDRWSDVTPDRDECLPLLAVTAAGARFVAVGAFCRYDAEARPRSDGVSYISIDGLNWERSPESPVLVDIGLEDVTWTGSEVVSAGVYFGSWTKTLHSVDGLLWELPTGSGIAEASYARRLAWAEERLVAVGSSKDSSGQFHATVWWSSDGIGWDQRVVGAVETQGSGIAYNGTEWILVGGEVESDTALRSFLEWRSPDGLDRGSPKVIFADGSGYFADLIANVTGLIGIGGVAPEQPGDPWVPAIMRLGS